MTFHFLKIVKKHLQKKFASVTRCYHFLDSTWALGVELKTHRHQLIENFRATTVIPNRYKMTNATLTRGSSCNAYYWSNKQTNATINKKNNVVPRKHNNILLLLLLLLADATSTTTTVVLLLVIVASADILMHTYVLYQRFSACRCVPALYSGSGSSTSLSLPSAGSASSMHPHPRLSG